MLKKIFILFFLLIFISSCWTIEEIKEEIDLDLWLDLYETEDFSLFTPNSWNLITDESKILPKPTVWEVDLAIISKTNEGWFYNNLIIIGQDLKSDLSSEEYSALNNIGSKKDYYSYNLVEEKNISFPEGLVSRLYTFEARYNKNTPKVFFMQVWVVCPWSKWFLLTMWLNNRVDDFWKYEQILKKFTCK